ncbi:MULTISPECIES: hypothetical protein [unclassified Colwellia]|uniref:hypothetical protein n=1 Tax=unclassified Colwellia TaxID=196834 RepID=UPI0028706C10|nr:MULTISPECIES: hypothetical protein [unclassified Colwellia]
MGIGYLPKNLIQNQIKSGALIVTKLAEERPPQALFMAWKITNKGKDLNKLITILSRR